MFTNSRLISFAQISPNKSSPRKELIKKITIHHNASTGRLENIVSWICRPEARASYNYVIGSDGRIALTVEERDRCWGSASPANDNQAVVIGVANSGRGPDWPISDEAFTSLINLCVDICKRNNIPQLTYDGTANGTLTRHNFFSKTTCPGPYLQSRFPEIVRLVNERLKGEKEMNQEKFNEMFAFAMNDFMREKSRTPPNDWSAKEREWAEENNLIIGVSEDSYQYAAYCTREQMVVFLYRLHELIGNDSAKKEKA